jgi:choline dehydrogenase
LAKRLTDPGISGRENSFSVVVIEAGSNNDTNPLIVDSANAPVLEEEYHNQFFYDEESVPQTGFTGDPFHLGAGRVLGGGTSINGEQACRPSSAVLTELAQAMGGPIFTVPNMLAAAKQMEHFVGTTTSTARGNGGPIFIRQSPAVPSNVATKLVAGVTSVTGLAEIVDYNNPITPLGPFTRWQLYQFPDGTRASSSRTFLPPTVMTPDGFGVGGRKLRVVMKATALRTLFKRGIGAPVATGVSFVQAGIFGVAMARKGIILCAGPHTPEFLLKSGVGDPANFEDVGQKLWVDSPGVGQGWINQLVVSVPLTVNPADLPMIPTSDPNAIYCGGAFTPSSPGGDRAFQLIGAPVSEDPQAPLMVIVGIPVEPLSRGVQSLISDDPLADTNLDFRYVQDAGSLLPFNPDGSYPANGSDKANLIACVRQILSVIAAMNLADPLYGLLPDSPYNVAPIDLTDELIWNTLIQTGDQTHHFVNGAACRPFVQGGVVDSYCRVYGAQNLLAIDSTVLPVSPDCNTSYQVFTIAWQMATYLRQVS